MKATTLLPLGLLLTGAASAQIATQTFDTGDPDDWGVEYVANAVHEASGGNPGGRIELAVQSSVSGLPAALVLPRAANHPYQGDFRSMGVTGFSIDRQVEMGAANFGTRPFVVIGNDNGTPTDFLDDTWLFFATGDVFQFGMSPWTTIGAAIPAGSPTIPTGWETAALPNSPFAGQTPDELWNAVIVDVDYVGISMDRPFGGAFWFGNHIISFDNVVLDGLGTVGTKYCGPAATNDAGLSGEIFAIGSAVVADNDLTLNATNLTPNQFGIFVTSRQSGLTPPGMVSNGALCLGGGIGRFNRPGQILSTGASGEFSLVVDLNEIPQGAVLVPVVAGDTWYFQAWHREFSGLGSNLTDAVQIDFQ